MLIMRYAYPVMLELSDRLVVLVGGGAVAVRKARGVVACGGNRLRCVAPRISPEMPAVVERWVEAYAERHLEGAHLVFAATDSPVVNDQVVVDARRRGILVCRTDAQEGQPGDFVTAAWHRDGEVVLAVSSGSAALSVHLRDRLARDLDPRYVTLAEVMRRLRPRLRRNPALSLRQRRDILRAMASEDALRIVEREGERGLLDWLAGRWVELNHVD